MTEQSGAERQNGAEQSARAERSGWGTRVAIVVSLLCIALVWLLGCVWSYEEQSGYATLKGFRIPWLLPLVLDGLAFSLAAVAFAASLDGRPALFARVATVAAVASSATSNGAFAWQRSGGDIGTLALAAGVPIAANLAFEVLLVEIRKQVMRRRGIPVPVALPYPRWQQMLLSPFRTFGQWRRLVLAATDLAPLFAAAQSAAKTEPEHSGDRSAPVAPAPAPVETPAEQSAPSQPEAQPERSAPPAPVRPAVRKSAPSRRSAPATPLHLVGAPHSPTARADAGTLRGRYGDALPERGAHALVQDEFGWGGSKATNAIKAYRERADVAPPRPGDEDDQEREPVLATATA